MDWTDRIFYILKGQVPSLFSLAYLLARTSTVLLYGRAISRATRQASVEGTVQGRPAVMRTLVPEDLDAMTTMIEAMSEEHLRFFRPHDFEPSVLAKIIARSDIMTYGLFVADEMCAYALLRLLPDKRAYIGRLVKPEAVGLGVGKYLSRFLYWQAYLLGFQACSTIHRDNLASLRSHASVRPFTVGAELRNGYSLIKFDLIPEDSVAPPLRIGPLPLEEDRGGGRRRVSRSPNRAPVPRLL